MRSTNSRLQKKAQKLAKLVIPTPVLAVAGGVNPPIEHAFGEHVFGQTDSSSAGKHLDTSLVRLHSNLDLFMGGGAGGGGNSVVAPGRESTGPVKNPSPPMHNSTTTLAAENYNVFLHQQQPPPPPPPTNSPVFIDLTVTTPENRSVPHVIDLTDATPTPPPSVIDLTNDTEPVTDEEELNEALNVWEQKAKEEAERANYGGGAHIVHTDPPASPSLITAGGTSLPYLQAAVAAATAAAAADVAAASAAADEYERSVVGGNDPAFYYNYQVAGEKQATTTTTTTTTTSDGPLPTTTTSSRKRAVAELTVGGEEVKVEKRKKRKYTKSSSSVHTSSNDTAAGAGVSSTVEVKPLIAAVPPTPRKTSRDKKQDHCGSSSGSGSGGVKRKLVGFRVVPLTSAVWPTRFGFPPTDVQPTQAFYPPGDRNSIVEIYKEPLVTGVSIRQYADKPYERRLNLSANDFRSLFHKSASILEHHARISEDADTGALTSQSYVNNIDEGGHTKVLVNLYKGQAKIHVGTSSYIEELYNINQVGKRRQEPSSNHCGYTLTYNAIKDISSRIGPLLENAADFYKDTIECDC